MCRYAVLESWNCLLTCQSDRRRVAPISDSVSCSAFLTTADLSRCANAQTCWDNKKASLSCDTERGCENKVGGDLLSRGCAVPSARLGLTSLFGMGRGDPQRYNHQNIVWTTQMCRANVSCKQHWLQLLLQRHILIHVPIIVPTLSRHAPCGGGGCKFRAISKARL